MGRIVGIDLGTTNSVVAVLEGGRPQVIASAEGGRTTPSVVGFSREKELLVGQLARRQLVLNPRNTFANLKRFVGRGWEELDEGSLGVPYTVRANDQGNVRIVCPATEREYAPEELVASILRKLVDDAATYLGEPVEAAVITVPAYFNDAQRQATRDAGRLAGLQVERILNEPTAAALAYGFDRSAARRVLVFDLGGGTFDVSVLRIANGVFDVKATSGDTQLGGNDWDRRIVDWLADAFEKEHGLDLRRDRQALQRLSEAAEKAKQELSGVRSTPISLPFIATGSEGPLHIETTLERGTFEALCPDLLDRLLRPVQRALRDSGMAADDIDDVVLVGGSTRMPMVQEMVRTLVPREPCQSVNPDEVVAIGAAVQAGILTGELRDLMLNDVTPLSLGLETIGGVMKVLIPRNTAIPVRKADVFSTSEANQNSVEIHVLQGERQMAVDNKSLGRFRLSGIPPAPPAAGVGHRSHHGPPAERFDPGGHQPQRGRDPAAAGGGGTEGGGRSPQALRDRSPQPGPDPGGPGGASSARRHPGAGSLRGRAPTAGRGDGPAGCAGSAGRRRQRRAGAGGEPAAGGPLRAEPAADERAPRRGRAPAGPAQHPGLPAG